MDFIREYIMSIIVVILFSVLLEMVMPGGTFKKYVKLVVGLLIMFVIIKPVINIPSVTTMLASYQLPRDDASGESGQVRERAEQVQDHQIKQAFSQSLSEQIADAVYKQFGINCQIHTEFDGKQIIVRIAADDKRRQEIADFIQNTYGVSAVEALR